MEIKVLILWIKDGFWPILLDVELSSAVNVVNVITIASWKHHCIVLPALLWNKQIFYFPHEKNQMAIPLLIKPTFSAMGRTITFLFLPRSSSLWNKTWTRKSSTQANFSSSSQCCPALPTIPAIWPTRAKVCVGSQPWRHWAQEEQEELLMPFPVGLGVWKIPSPDNARLLLNTRG